MKSIRFLTSVLCLFVCMLLFAAPAWAGEQDYAYYYDAAIGGAVVTSYTGSEAHVTVPDTLGGYPVRKMEFGVFDQLGTLLSVTLPDTLVSMNGGAFYACYNLQSVYLPENLTEFPNASAPGQTIFYVDKDCATAKLMLNDAGVFPSSRFADPEYPGMQFYYVASSAPELGLYKYTAKDDEILTVPDGVMHIYDQAFVPEGYSQNAALKEIYLPHSVVSVGMQAFISSNTPNLEAVYLSDNIASWSSEPFNGLFNLRLYCSMDSVTARTLPLGGSGPSGFVDPEYPDMMFYYTASAATGAAELGLYKYLVKDEENVTIPDGVMHIYNQAFVPEDYSQNAALKEIHLPDSVISVGMQAFVSLNTPNLEAVYLSDNIAAWGSNPFNGLFNLRLYCSMDSTTARTFPNDGTGSPGFIDPADPDFAWKSDGSGGLILARYYGSASTLTIPDGVTAIGDRAFFDVKTLTSIVIPENVTKIGGWAFEYDDYWSDPDSYAERTIYLPDHITFTGDYPFNTIKTKLVIHRDSATAKDLMRLNDEFGSIFYSFYDPQYPDYLIAQFGGETYLMGYTGTDTVINVPPICDVIEGHINLSTPNSDYVTHINIPEGVTRLNPRALWGWPKIHAIKLPSTLREIGEYAFSNNNFPVLIIPDGVTHLPAYMTDNSIIRYITIPASVTSIDETAIITSGGMRTYKIYCNKGSYAETWAKAHSVPVGYLENADYTFYVSEQFIGDVGETVDWRETVVVAPMEPDFPYTITAKSSNPDVVSVEGDDLRFNSYGQTSIRFTSEELGYNTLLKEIYAYNPVESFTMPAYIFEKFSRSNTKSLSVSNVVPAAKTNPTYLWQRHETENTGRHFGDLQKYQLSFIDQPGVYEFDVTAHSGVSRAFTLVYYQTLGSASFSPFSGRTAAGMTVQPEITVTVDGLDYKNIAVTYTLTSSNTSVAKPTADGKLELLSPGTAVITAKFLNGTTAKQTITVADERIYTISAGVKTIEKEAFLSCPATIVTIPDSCVSIGERAFADCASLYVIEIPKSVSFIAENAFDGCRNLTIIAPAGSYAESYAKTHGFAAGEE